jgi:hypothetical protein
MSTFSRTKRAFAGRAVIVLVVGHFLADRRGLKTTGRGHRPDMRHPRLWSGFRTGPPGLTGAREPGGLLSPFHRSG